MQGRPSCTGQFPWCGPLLSPRQGGSESRGRQAQQHLSASTASSPVSSGPQLSLSSCLHLGTPGPAETRGGAEGPLAMPLGLCAGRAQAPGPHLAMASTLFPGRHPHLLKPRCPDPLREVSAPETSSRHPPPLRAPTPSRHPGHVHCALREERSPAPRRTGGPESRLSGTRPAGPQDMQHGGGVAQQVPCLHTHSPEGLLRDGSPGRRGGSLP